MACLFGAVTTDFGFGLLFGATLLIAGICVGVWLRHHFVGKEDSHSLDAYHLGALLKGLFRWTDGFASDISDYREEMDRIGEVLQSSGEEGETADDGSILPMLSQIVNANEEITSRMAKAEATLQQQATDIEGYMSEARTDALTGLPNRRAFDDELARRFAEWRRNGRPVSVVFYDIDHFKKFNDRHGHLAGDAVLTQVAHLLRDAMHESDMVARLGGEEFAAILPNCKVADAAQAAERARVAIEKAPCRYEDKLLHVTVSCGAAQAAKDEVATSLIKRADEAMYASKNAGRNCTHTHDGQACVPAPSDSKRSGSADQSAKLSNCIEFRQVCQDLRQRLMAVVDEET